MLSDIPDRAETPATAIRAAFADPARGRLLSLTGWWFALVAAFAVPAAVWFGRRPDRALPDFYLLQQDILVLGCASIAFLLAQFPSIRFSADACARAAAFVERRAGRICLALAAASALIGIAGWRWPYHRYPLSLDEFWAGFDTVIFAKGRLLAALPEAWRPFAAALQPQWRLETPGSALWSSTYLPMNAAFRALFSHLGSAALAGPFWCALSIAMIYAVARSLWPERRDAAVLAALFLATSSQFLVNGMSAYAMAPHLALNLTWLWLFLRKSRWAQGLAVATAFAATGLHQLVFHPLFATPFVLQLWLSRRWGRAAFHTVAYAGVCLFWVSYWSLALGAAGLSAGAAGSLAGGGFVDRVLALIAHTNASALGLMGENLLRFIAWQNPFAVVLAVATGTAAVRAWRTPLAALAVGIGLMVIVAGAVLAYQGHGWGYRYLHGFLGSLCLLAAGGWIRLTATADAVELRRAWGTLSVLTVFAAGLAFPVRLVQVDRMIAPPARAFQLVRNAEAEVVLLDPTGMVFGVDLVRNDPFLRNTPKILDITRLRTGQVAELCRRYRVAVFDVSDAPWLKAGGANGDAPRRSKGALELARIPACARHVSARSPAPNGS